MAKEEEAQVRQPSKAARVTTAKTAAAADFLEPCSNQKGAFLREQLTSANWRLHAFQMGT